MSAIAVAESIALLSASWAYWDASYKQINGYFFVDLDDPKHITPFFIFLAILSLWITFFPIYIYCIFFKKTNFVGSIMLLKKNIKNI
ncbi:MAG: hypothetical protein WCY67_03790 [Acidithiobacillus sp.]